MAKASRRPIDIVFGEDFEPGWLTFLKWGSVLSFVVVGVYVGFFVQDGSPGSALLLAGGMHACGYLLGFLFGHPRWIEVAAAGVGNTRRSKPSTNLEKISDWITTLIVGLTLVNFDAAMQRVQSFCKFAAPCVSAEGKDVAATTAIVILFAVTGFLFGYLYTRLKLQDDFDRDRLAEEPAYLEGVMNAYLYRDPPESFRTTLKAAAEFERKFPEAGNYRVYLQLAIAHAQEYVFHSGRAGVDPAKRVEEGKRADDAKAKCLEALAEAYSREPDCIEFLHVMWEPALAPATENDLTHLRGEQSFKDFFQKRLPQEKLLALRSRNIAEPKDAPR